MKSKASWEGFKLHQFKAGSWNYEELSEKKIEKPVEKCLAVGICH